MKNEELLADAIGGLDEELLISVNRKRGMEDTNKLIVVKNEAQTEKPESWGRGNSAFSELIPNPREDSRA